MIVTLDRVVKGYSQLKREQQSNVFVSAGVYDSPGTRQSMEDCHNMFLPNKRTYIKTAHPHKEMKNESIPFFMVCDGHGGAGVANFVNVNLYQLITRHPKFDSDIEAAILGGFAQLETHLPFVVTDGAVGTTVTIALLMGSTLFIATVGDSKAVVFRQGAIEVMTEVHDPSNPQEQRRVQEEGGNIITLHKQQRLGHPVWNRNYVNLGVTRALGDFYFKSKEWVGDKKSGLIATPTIIQWNLSRDEDFMIIASDGFWNVVSPAEAIAFVKQCLIVDLNLLCKCLVLLAQSKNSTDNITVLLVWFKIVPNEICYYL